MSLKPILLLILILLLSAGTITGAPKSPGFCQNHPQNPNCVSPIPATPTPLPTITSSPTAIPTPTVTPSPSISPTPTPTISPTSTLYGSGIGADSLANTQVGGTSCGCSNLMSAYRFKAGQSSNLVSIRIYVVDGSGYAGGNGGTVQITVQTDSGGNPSGNILATTSIQTGNPVNIGYLPLVTFTTPATLTSGQYYHIVFKNIDPSPTINYVSINSLFTFGSVVIQPKIPTGEWSQRLNTGSGWSVRQNFNPILALNYSNGVSEGMGYMEVWINAPKTISGAAKARELFTSSVSESINTVGIRLRRISGTSPLIITLEDSLGTQINQTSIDAALIPTGSTDRGSSWVSALFPTNSSLVNGQTYHLVFSTSSDTTYSIFSLERGNNYRFSPSTYFSDGYGQYTSDSITWKGFDQPGGSTNNTNSDLQFYLK